MSLQPQLLKLVNWVYKRERDHGRARHIWQEFDQNRHYAEYLARCQAAWQRPTAPTANADLQQRGFSYLRALAPAAAAEYSAELENRHQPQLLKKGSRDLEGFRIDDRRWMQGPADAGIAGSGRWRHRRLLRQRVPGALGGAVADACRAGTGVGVLPLALRQGSELAPEDHRVPERDRVTWRQYRIHGSGRHSRAGRTGLPVRVVQDAHRGCRTSFAAGGSPADRTHAGAGSGRIGAVPALARAASRHQPHARTAPDGDFVFAAQPRALAAAYECETLSDLAVDEKWHDDALVFLSQLETRLQGHEAKVNS